ncbi:hypothetical protein PP175_28780 (plasmid) [Aneurinibacillus sp. Ricciae_BoGa-3]|uniref:hypothetical protein n=1 Tax=Aneurinibacillus sp. Ricciae_BoGa-3 TaxID=3022697 RepID=UPI0023403C2B|nr:hypothetical protein [Aneurinibacillus sp. Ricciae_BoGa-3]WCK57186.1 hypothetical protein PP175_28780 [Aneurinibacillus sp. Ricciae_BoGa-3]
MKLATILTIINRHSTAFMQPVSPNAILFTYGATDELEDMMHHIEEAFGIELDREEFDVCEIGEWKVSAFIGKIEQKILQKSA